MRETTQNPININKINNLHMIARTDGRHSICSFCSVFLTVLHYASHKIPTFFVVSIVLFWIAYLMCSVGAGRACGEGISMSPRRGLGDSSACRVD